MTLLEKFTNKKILITGASGFIGSHLAGELSGVPCSLALVDNCDAPGGIDLGGKADIVLHPLDILQDEFLDLISNSNFDFIFHLAGNANVRKSVTDPDLDFRLNLQATFAMLEVLRRTPRETIFINASSAAVYGNPLALPIKEVDATFPISPYGVSKLTSERYLDVYCNIYGLRGASVRMFSPYGPKLRKQIVYDLIQKLFKNPSRLEVLGDGTQTRDFIYVDDLISAILHVACMGNLNGSVYNIAGGDQITTSSIVDRLVRIMGTETDIVYSLEDNPGYPQRWCADIKKIANLGWRASVPLDDGLRKTVAWVMREYSQH